MMVYTATSSESPVDSANNFFKKVITDDNITSTGMGVEERYLGIDTDQLIHGR
jgi:hypothetical protein